MVDKRRESLESLVPLGKSSPAVHVMQGPTNSHSQWLTFCQRASFQLPVVEKAVSAEANVSAYIC